MDLNLKQCDAKYPYSKDEDYAQGIFSTLHGDVEDNLQEAYKKIGSLGVNIGVSAFGSHDIQKLNQYLASEHLPKLAPDFIKDFVAAHPPGSHRAKDMDVVSDSWPEIKSPSRIR